MNKLIKVFMALSLLVCCFTSVSAQEPNDSPTITVSVPVRIQASYTGSETAGDTQFTFTATDMNGNNLQNGVTFTADYITLPNGHNNVTGYITFYLDSTEASKDLLENGILFRMVVGNKSGWTYDTATYTLKFTFPEDGVDVNAYAIEKVSVNNGAYQDFGATGWQLNFYNYYKSGNVVVTPPDGYVPPKRPSHVGCAGKYDYNCDGKVSCGERYGDGYVWSDSANGCVYSYGNTIANNPPLANTSGTTIINNGTGTTTTIQSNGQTITNKPNYGYFVPNTCTR